MTRTAARAPRLPSSASASSVPRRERTSANSAATKNPLSRTSTSTANSSRMLMRRGVSGASRARRYFGRSRRRSSGDGTMLPDPQAVNPGREIAVGLGQRAGGVRREREADVVPAVDQDVRMVVGRLGHLRHLVDERHRAGEVGEREVADEGRALLAPLAHILIRVRIVSLVPSATEMLFALGLGDEVTAVTHECDHPPEALDLPKVTRDLIGPGLEAGEIDRAVRELTEQGRAIYELDEAALRDLQPDLIVTQALCAVCAVSYDDVKAVAERIEPEPRVISLDPRTLGEVLGDVRTLAEATDAKDAGVGLVQDAASRIDRVRLAVRAAPPVAVAALEWLDPVYVAGHWTPQLIEYAGGVDVLGLAGEHSDVRSWEEIAAARPEVVVVMPCGYDAERALEEAYDFQDELEELGARRIVAVDASAYFSRPGPRLVDGLELLAHILHPDRVPERPSPSTRVLEVA